MGSPLSPIVVNLYMETFEKIALTTALAAPRLWARYTDDMFVIWPHGQDKLEAFHQHLNTQHPQIEVTMEREEDNKIRFLDVAITKLHQDRGTPWTQAELEKVSTGNP